jgi:tetratricopeptide (TPR) repeat protein
MEAGMTPRVCLNMIVKDERAIIEACCRALVGAIDCYVICDTGSTDDTVKLIRKVFGSASIPGEIHHTRFEHFEQARNEALELARRSDLEFDYVLLCDADMELVQRDPLWKRSLSGPSYSIKQRNAVGGLEYANIRLVHREHPARYVGVTHEYLDVGAEESPVLEGVRYIDHAVGSSRSVKFERDIRLLTEALEAEPDDTRSVFYLANSYFDMGSYATAIDWYTRRVAMGGYEGEVFISKYRIGTCHLRLGDEAQFYRQMLLTFDEHPHRAETVHALALHAQQQSRHSLAHHLAMMGVEIPKPSTDLFVEPEVYEWRLADIVAVSLYWLGRKDEALTINERLLSIVPESERARIEQNLEWCHGRQPV